MLRTHKLGEADRIVTMLSKRHGKVRAVAKGVRRTSSRFGARLEPFMVADVQLYIGRSLDIVQQAESLGSYGADIAAHYDRYTSASAMVETADRLNEAEATPQQYLLLVGGLRALARGEHASRSILDSYMLRAMALSGWAPGLTECARCGAPGPHQILRRPARRPRLRRTAPRRAARGSAPTRSRCWHRSCRATGRAWMPRARATPRAPRASSPPTRSGTSSAASARSRTSREPGDPQAVHAPRCGAVPSRRLDRRLSAGVPARVRCPSTSRS